MEDNPIETWWPRVPTPAKEWLRGNLFNDSLPDDVAQGIRTAGGPAAGQAGAAPLLARRDWQFIETQSEFVD